MRINCNCREWTQVKDGRMCALPLKADLSSASGDAITLFSASQAPWVTRGPRPGYWVTDGPSIIRTRSGVLLMAWSSFTETGYSVGIARSPSSSILGPWQHDSEPLYRWDGGHGSFMRTLGGELRLALHQPNSSPLERGRLLPLYEGDDDVSLAGEV